MNFRMSPTSRAGWRVLKAGPGRLLFADSLGENQGHPGVTVIVAVTGLPHSKPSCPWRGFRGLTNLEEKMLLYVFILSDLNVASPSVMAKAASQWH